MILDEVKEEYVRDLLAKGERTDGRGLYDYRPIAVEKNVIPNAEGSAMAHIGGSKVLAGLKFDLLEPFKDRPDEGVVMVNAEFSPIAHPNFEAGPPRPESIELARVVDRGIRSAETVDVKKLAFEKGEKVLGIFIDLYILDHSGNLIDAAALASMAALRSTRVPKVEDGVILREEIVGKLELSKDVVATSVEKIGGKLVVDATDEEEVASEGRLSIATCGPDTMCAGQKSGRAGFSKDEIMQAVDLAFEKRNELVKYL
ncbi:MAG: exosome complex protein Rrp42 [Candidatus Micrarchaeia archaeon]|jgi:exosome complex component RRP42